MTLQGSATGSLHDLEARRIALTDRQHGLVVEAGAGSGKTAILAGRVALLMADGVPPKNIAAITFTELAAAELASRIREYVDDLAGGVVPTTLAAAFPTGSPSQSQRDTLGAARRELDELTCSTIHGFARELVRPYPVEADIDPGAGVLEPAEQALLFDEVFEAWLRQQLGEQNRGAAAAGDHDPSNRGTGQDAHGSGLSAVARFFIGDDKDKRETLVGLVRHLHEHPEASAEQAADLGQVARWVDQAGRSFHSYAQGQPGATVIGDMLGQLPTLLQALADLKPDAECAVRVLTVARPEPLFTKSGTVRKLRGKGKWVDAAREEGLSKSEAEEAYALAAELHAEWGAAFGELCDAAADGLLAELVQELKHVGARYQERKRAAAALDFDDLIRTALKLLREHPSVRDELAQRYQHVLIDEFQDTDPLQAEIVWRITGVPSDADWRQWPSRTGARFVVGDPKQSIYRFRGADAATYALLTQSLSVGAGSMTVELNTNFRSRANILQTVNQTFAVPLEAEDQPGYRPLHAWKTATETLNVVRLNVPGPNGADSAASAEELREAEAQAVAALVLGLIEGTSGTLHGPVPAGDIALLAPVGSGLEIYERALDALDINVASQAGKGFYRRQEVQDLVALTRSVAEPRDRLAFGALLKGPLVGATDEELLDATDLLSHLEGDERYLSVLTDSNLLPAGRIRRTLERLQPLVSERFSTAPYNLLSRALDAMQVRAVLEHRHGQQADRALANVDRYLAHSRPFDVRGLTAFTQHVWAAWADSESELEGRTDSASESVTLITIHSAKGLEWPVVIPINTASGPRAVSGVLYDRRSNMVATKLFGQACSVYDSTKQQEELELAAERMRLWYVAATRARDLLVVPTHAAAVNDNAWCNMLEWSPAAPLIEAQQPAGVRRQPKDPRSTAQPRELFQEEANAITSALKRIERRAPSRREDQTTETLAAEGREGGAEPDARYILDEEGAGSVLATLDQADDATVTQVLKPGTARGILFHKLLEELINGETATDATALEARATELAQVLEVVGEPFDAAAVGALAHRTWHMPEIEALHGRLLAEVEVAGVEADPDNPAGQVYWSGIADAVALSDDGTVRTVIDWKSDMNPADAAIEHYQEQLRAYLRLTGATEGLLVLSSLGRVVTVTTD